MAGLEASMWLALFDASCAPGWSGPQRVAWPDGGALLDQYAVTVLMFETLAWAQAQEAEMKRAD